MWNIGGFRWISGEPRRNIDELGEISVVLDGVGITGIPN